MSEADFRLVAILRIAHYVSKSGDGLALRDAIARSDYGTYRSSFDAQDLQAVLTAHPALIEEWLAYSEDKRTDAGWYVLRDGEIGQLQNPTSQRSYATIEEAVAQFIVRELDFWAGASL
jgi:hypothetical protein